MKLNRIEKALMNNPVRAFVQRNYEAAVMERLGGRVEGKRVLEIGCGRGVGTEIIFKRFLAREVHAFDVDPDMLALARKRLVRFPPDRLRLFVGDAAAIEVEDASFDAVFDFGIIHHIPDWKKAVREVGRVLRPGGRFFFEEVTKKALDRWFYRTFLDHPTRDRFHASEFLDELNNHGILVAGNTKEWWLGDFVIGVGGESSKAVRDREKK